MSGGNYSAGKRQRDAAKARKKRQKDERRTHKREAGPSEVPIGTQEDVLGERPDVSRPAPDSEAARDARAIPCRLFVGGLSWDTDEELLKETFGRMGKVADCIVMRDRDTGKSRGFGFVTYADRKDANRAIDELHGSELDGRDLVVNVATERRR